MKNAVGKGPRGIGQNARAGRGAGQHVKVKGGPPVHFMKFSYLSLRGEKRVRSSEKGRGIPDGCPGFLKMQISFSGMRMAVVSSPGNGWGKSVKKKFSPRYLSPVITNGSA